MKARRECLQRRHYRSSADLALFEAVKQGKVTINRAAEAVKLKESDPELYKQLRQGNVR
jgi:hypothetical protein